MNPPQGCFTHLGGKYIRVDQLFGWELVMTFLLVSVVFAVAISKPGHGNIGPLAVVSGCTQQTSTDTPLPAAHQPASCSVSW
jgi:glycerol uptake facilitator-like aquaporin